MTDTAFRSDYVLHPEVFDMAPAVGEPLAQTLANRAAEVDVLTALMPDVDVSYVIRTQDEAEHLAAFFVDLAVMRERFSGEVQVVVVDNESLDDTVAVAKANDATVVPIVEYSHPRALNMGVDAADHPYVVMTVGHSRPTTTMLFRAITYWDHRIDNLAGISGFSIFDSTASSFEIDYYRNPKALASLKKIGLVTPDDTSGVMIANASVIAKSAWEEVGGYDERYGHGGEDLVMGRRLMDEGFGLVREPLVGTHHSHGLDEAGWAAQKAHWQKLIDGPGDFDPADRAYRPAHQERFARLEQQEG